MDFTIGLPILTDLKGNRYDSILVIIDQLTKMVHYKPVKVTIAASDLAEVIINIVMKHHRLLDSIVINEKLLFTLK